jgi:hypothetical protein
MSGRIDAARLAVQATLIPESQGLVEKESESWIEMIAIPKSSRPSSDLSTRPTYRRGWTYSLKPGTEFVAIPFVRKEGGGAVGLVLRDPSDDFIAGWFDQSRADEVARVVKYLNEEIACELARYGSPQRDSITLEIGNEHAPDSPHGTERVTVTPDGRIEYAQRNRGATRDGVGTAGDALWEALTSAVSKTTFPKPPQESFVPGGAMMRLTVEGDRSGQVLLDYYDALEMAGYGEITSIVGAIAAAFRSGDFEPLARWNLKPVR